MISTSKQFFIFEKQKGLLAIPSWNCQKASMPVKGVQPSTNGNNNVQKETKKRFPPQESVIAKFDTTMYLLIVLLLCSQYYLMGKNMSMVFFNLCVFFNLFNLPARHCHKS